MNSANWCDCSSSIQCCHLHSLQPTAPPNVLLLSREYPLSIQFTLICNLRETAHRFSPPCLCAFLPTFIPPLIFNSNLSQPVKYLATSRDLLVALTAHPVCCVHMAAWVMNNESSKTVLRRIPFQIQIFRANADYHLCSYHVNIAQHMHHLYFIGHSYLASERFYFFLFVTIATRCDRAHCMSCGCSRNTI